MNEHQKRLMMSLPETEYGQALFAWINEEIALQEKKEGTSWKICDDPLIEDFRVQLGIKIGLKRVLLKPQKLKEAEHRKGLKR